MAPTKTLSIDQTEQPFSLNGERPWDESADLTGDDISWFRNECGLMHSQLSQRIYGQNSLKDLLIRTAVTRSGVLLTGHPNAGKTSAGIKLGQLLLARDQFSFADLNWETRITDLVGYWDVREGRWHYGVFRPNVVGMCLNEVTRVPPYAQSGFLTPLEEGDFTIRDKVGDNQRCQLNPHLFIVGTGNLNVDRGTAKMLGPLLDRFEYGLELNRPDKRTRGRINHARATNQLSSTKNWQASPWATNSHRLERAQLIFGKHWTTMPEEISYAIAEITEVFRTSTWAEESQPAGVRAEDGLSKGYAFEHLLRAGKNQNPIEAWRKPAIGRLRKLITQCTWHRLRLAKGTPNPDKKREQYAPYLDRAVRAFMGAIQRR